MNRAAVSEGVTGSGQLEMVRQLANHAVATYQTVRRLKSFLNESEQIASQAERFLRLATQQYFASGGNWLPLCPNDRPISSSPEGIDAMVDAYVDIQVAYADLKQALFDLLTATINDVDLDEALGLLEPFRELDPSYLGPGSPVRGHYLAQLRAQIQESYRTRDEQRIRELLRLVLKVWPRDGLALLPALLESVGVRAPAPEALAYWVRGVEACPSYARCVALQEAWKNYGDADTSCALHEAWLQLLAELPEHA